MLCMLVMCSTTIYNINRLIQIIENQINSSTSEFFFFFFTKKKKEDQGEEEEAAEEVTSTVYLHNLIINLAMLNQASQVIFHYHHPKIQTCS